jgi:hypothetical protein
MSISFRARGIDLFNLMIGKASSFLLTAILFSIASRVIDANAFPLFGYWWSIGIMIGGVFLGGTSSATVRMMMVTESLKPALHFSKWFIVTVLLTALAIAVAATYVGLANPDQILLVAVVSAFGIGVMLQAVIFGLLRALEASRANTIASVVVVFLVPGLTWLLSGDHPRLLQLFGALAIAFAFGAVACFIIAWPMFQKLLRSDTAQAYDSRRIARDAFAFTVVNIFSYAVVNVDFTLIKWIGTQDEFVLISSSKVYFERFVLPGLLVFAGAISLRVLRHAGQPSIGLARIETRLSAILAASALLLIFAVTLGYWVFTVLIRNDPHQLAWASVIAASVGYLLFAFNAVLLDVLVLRVSTMVVLAHVLTFIALGGAIQWFAFITLRVSGWGGGWLVFNAAVTVVLAFECLYIKLGRDGPQSLSGKK